jgi:S-adenosylmethionine:diacylglycerol 3-amino-3-carboxypropyl transferase
MTPWLRGRFHGSGPPQLLFGHMWEDAAIERRHFSPGARIFAIASAGCTARSLSAHGCHVTAVDINPTQLAYAQSRGPHRLGAADRGLAYLRRLAPLAGWTTAHLETFLHLADPAAQLPYWRAHLDTARFRCALDTLLRPRALSLVYRSTLLQQLPANFGAVLRQRLERGFARHPNRHNPYLHCLLAGVPVPSPDPVLPIAWHHADAAQFLLAAPRRSFDGLTLSNILDGAPPAYAQLLRQAIAHAAAPGAPVLLRSFAEPSTSLAIEDRALLWGQLSTTAADILAKACA